MLILFTKEQVLRETQEILSGNKLHEDSKVYEAWEEIATDWLRNYTHNYVQEGFRGFNERTPEEILYSLAVREMVSDVDPNDAVRVCRAKV